MTQNKKYNQLRTDQVKIPRDAKAVETTISQALKDSKVIADNGKAYDTIQAAQDAASSWIKIPPETFNETATIDTTGLKVLGSGKNTLINGESGKGLKIDASDVIVSSLSIKTDSSSGASCLTTGSSAQSIKVVNCRAEQSGTYGFWMADGGQHIISDCYATLTEKGGFRIDTTSETVLTNSIAKDVARSDGNGISAGANAKNYTVSNCILDTTGSQTSNNQTGINVRTDCVVYGNRVLNADHTGIEAFNTGSVVVNNRVSGSGSSNVKESGSGNIVRNNLTGSAN